MDSKITNLNELESVLCDNNKTNEGVLHFFERFKISNLLASFNQAKCKGIKISILITAMCLFRIQGLSIWAIQKLGDSNLLKADDNTFYRLMNNPYVQWRKLLLAFAKQFKTVVEKNGISANEIKCFVIDDTDIEKTGNTFEFISRIYNHVFHKYVLGFKLLALGYWDGKSLISLDFSMHREKGKKGNFGLSKKEKASLFSKSRDDNSPAKARVRELDIKKTEIAVSMIKRAVKNGFKATYVLMDSWFTNDYIIKSIRSIKGGMLHVLGMCKLDKRKYNINGKSLNAREIIVRYARKSGKYSRIHKSHYIPIVVEYKGIRVKLFFVKYRNAKNWTILLTTNHSLSFTQALEIYQIRWTIEVMFKECKQYLRLGMSQNTDFDGQIADATLVFITHTILTLQRRFAVYETMGELFRKSQQILSELTLWERILKVFKKMLLCLVEVLNIDINETMIKLMKDTKANYQILKILSTFDNANFLPKTAA